jgi:hypothetical protein
MFTLPMAREDRPDKRVDTDKNRAGHCTARRPLSSQAARAARLTIFADVNGRQRASAAADCSAATEKTERPAYCDILIRAPAPHPCKGANAPAGSGSP